MKTEALRCARAGNGSVIPAVIFWIWVCCTLSAVPAWAADNPDPPTSPIKLIFIHHSTGGHWLADANESGPYGMLGKELANNNYYVSATNYGWGPGSIGDRTDIINWPEWFTGSNHAAILTALFAETGQNILEYGDWSRLKTDPGGENQIVLFKSCFPNSDLYGNPTDGAYSEPNDWEFSVANAKAVYNSLLTTFSVHQDKLFVVITAPPLAMNEYAHGPYQSPASCAANARAFNNWLIQNWLTGYPYNNVAVFDYYNVLTSNGGNANTSDVNQTSGNHHRWWNGSVQHVQEQNNNFASYPSGDSHPSSAGHQKATSEFVSVLNVFYHRWKTETPAKPDVDCIFDWIVREYPAYFQPASAATTWSGEDLAFRYFSDSLAYLAAYFGTVPEYADSLLYLGPLTENTIANLGPIDTWASVCKCQGLSETLPKAATLVSPNGTSGSTPPFSWNAVSNATSYYLWVNDSDSTRIQTWFTAAQAGCASGTGICTVTPGTSLSDGSYIWWIQTENDFGRGPWSQGMNFSVSISRSNLLQAADFSYLGAFRLPDGSDRPLTFEYGGGAMTYNPNGDSTGTPDGFPGSLFIMGHNRMPYGELPDGNQIAEVNIPVPTIQPRVASLKQSGFIQSFHNADNGVFAAYEEIPRAGMAYLNHPATGPQIHLSFGQHFQENTTPTHAWFDTDLSVPNLQGAWFVGNQSPYSTSDYLFEITSEWADIHARGKYLATGRFRDGGWSGMGPALFAYCPWTDSAGTPAPADTRLQETTLLLYESSENTPDIENALQGYQHPDEWSGGQWITTSSGKSGVLFVGNKGVGEKYWYGYINPLGNQYPCVDAASVDGFTACRMANGQPCPDSDMIECAGHTSLRGWWASEWRAQIILYDPADLARVASGAIESWEPQPYSSVSIQDRMYLNPDQVDTEALGTGVQRRELVGDVAFDRSNGLLYILELFADGTKPVVHVWRVN
jgi:hypothetical protein